MAKAVELKKIVCNGESSGPRLLITGGVHGDEFEPMAAIRQLAAQFKQEALAGAVTLVPVVNEAAFQRGSRTAEDGLDLARVCPGDPQGSVTQRIANELAKLICDSDFYIDLHTGGTNLSIYPLAGYMLHSNPKVRECQHKMAHAFNLPLVWGTDGTLNGRSLSVARDANIPAIYVEYHGAATCDPSGVQAMVDGCLNVMASLSMLDRSLSPSQVIDDIQETRPDSGFFQRSHLAPRSGFFEPTVSLGDFVKVGETIGWVADPLGQQRVEILADTTGKVICLRTFSAVEKNDSLGYLVETGKKNNE